MFKTWNRLHRKKEPDGCTIAMRLACVLFGTRAFLVLYLSSSHPFMPGEPAPRTDHYPTCNSSTGGVLDADRMFSGQLLTRNAWKLTNNGTKLMTHLAKPLTTPILNCGNLIITNYLITILSVNLSRNSTLNTIKCISKLLPKKELSTRFQNTGCRDFWRDYDNLNVATDPNVS